MKKIYHFLGLFMSICLFSGVAFGQNLFTLSGVNYDMYKWDESATLYSCYENQIPDTVVIPKTIEHEGVVYKVKTNLYPALRGIRMKVLIWEADCDIPEKLCQNCPNLETVIIKGRVEAIDKNAFANCENLEKLILNEELLYLGYQAFYNCSSLKEVTLPAKLRTMQTNVFSYCTSLKKVTIKNKDLDKEVGNYIGMYFKDTPYAETRAKQPEGKRKPNQAVTNNPRFKVKKSGTIVY